MSRRAVIVSDAEDSRALCRLCMIYHENVVNIFTPNNTFRICAEEAIHDLLSLKVAVGDGLPSNICHQCVKKLMDFRDFKEMCLKTAAELRKSDLDIFLKVSKVKDEDAADVETSKEGSSRENTFLNNIQVTEVYITTPDELAIGNESYAKDELWSYENALVVKEEVIGEEHRIEGDVPVDALTSVAVDPLAIDTMSLKEEAQEPKETAGEGNSLGDTSSYNHIQVTEVFLPVPDELAMGILRYAEEDARPTELIVKEEIGEGLECSENDIPVGSLSSVNVDPLAVDTTVDRCNNTGGLTEEPEKESDELEADRQGISQNQVLNNPFCDPVYEKNLQLEYSLANSFVVDCFPEKREKKLKKNIKLNASSKNLSQFNDSARLIRDHECEQLCHQVENTNYSTEYICNYCSTRYSEKKSLALHIKRHVDGKWLASILPKKDFSPRFYQNLLVKDRENAENVIIETSNISYTRKSSRRKNQSYSTEYLCNYCNTRFLEKNSLALHVKIHMDGMRPAIVLPKKDFQPRFSQSVLVKDQGNFESVIVEPINISVTQKGSRRKNEKLAVEDSSEGENLGRKLCNSITLLFKSVKPREKALVKALKCNECGKMFSRKSFLNEHSVVHTGVKRFKCNECGKMFTQSSALKRHSVVHTGVKPFKCNECGKMFSRKGYLNEHSVVHTGVKRFKCNECGKMFTQSSALKSHSVLHTGVKPFKCNECGKMFSRKGYLNEHSVVHTGVKPFKCDFCGEQFKWRVRLNAHLNTHADRNPSK